MMKLAIQADKTFGFMMWYVNLTNNCFNKVNRNIYYPIVIKKLMTKQPLWGFFLTNFNFSSPHINVDVKEQQITIFNTDLEGVKSLYCTLLVWLLFLSLIVASFKVYDICKSFWLFYSYILLLRPSVAMLLLTASVGKYHLIFLVGQVRNCFYFAVRNVRLRKFGRK